MTTADIDRMKSAAQAQFIPYLMASGLHLYEASPFDVLALVEKFEEAVRLLEEMMVIVDTQPDEADEQNIDAARAFLAALEGK